jgi:hypothetical protein
MDFLKSAVASAMAKGSSLPFSLGDRVDSNETLWTLHNATKRVSSPTSPDIPESDLHVYEWTWRDFFY